MIQYKRKEIIGDDKMRRWKKMILSCLVIGIVWSLGTTCMAGDKVQEDRVDQVEVLEDKIEEELSKGKSSFTIYIHKEISAEQLQEINNNLDGFYGYVERYSQWHLPFVNYYKTVFYLNNSDNFYVLDHLMGEYSFTEEQKKGKELAEAVEEIQDSIITASMTDYEKVKAVHDYLIDTTSYKEQEETKGNYDDYNAYGVLVEREGVCNGYTQAFQIFMEINQIESRIVLGNAGGINHSWNLVRLEDEWYHVDATWDDPVPDEKNRRIYAYFNVTDEYIQESHEWKKEKYPKAVGTKYNYYVQNNSVIENQDEFIKYIKQKLKEQAPVIHCMVRNYREEEYGSTLFQKVMADTSAVSLNLQMYGEGADRAFRLVPDYGRSLNE